MPTIANFSVLALSFLLLLLSIFPVKLIGAYIILRPLVQPFSMLNYDLLGLPVTFPFSIAIFVSLLYSILSANWKLFPPKSAFIYLMICTSIFSFTNTIDFTISFAHLAKLITNLFIFIIVYNSVRSEKDIDLILYACTLTSFLPSLFGLYQYFSNRVYSYEIREFVVSNRIDSVMGVCNEYGVYIVVSVISTLIIYNRKRKVIFLIYCGLLISQLIFSLNRGTWIALGIASLASGILYIRTIRLRTLIGIILALMVLSITVSGIVKSRFAELGRKDQFGQSQNTLQGRIEHWQAILPMIISEPIFGHGLGTSSELAKRKFNFPAVPHNDFLRLMLEAGIPTALFYFLFLFSELLRQISLSRQNSNWQINIPMLILLFYYIIISSVQNIVFNMIIPGMLLALIAVSHKANDSSSETATKLLNKRVI